MSVFSRTKTGYRAEVFKLFTKQLTNETLFRTFKAKLKPCLTDRPYYTVKEFVDEHSFSHDRILETDSLQTSTLTIDPDCEPPITSCVLNPTLLSPEDDRDDEFLVLVMV